MERERDHHDGELFGWTDGRIAIFVDRDASAWVIARGWLDSDRLTDVRRWRFDTERRVLGQLARLVHEATGEHRAAAEAAGRLADWLARQASPI
jgi:hypothetical protein